MLFKELRTLEFNRVALRLLMSEFYRSSLNGWVLYENISGYAREEKRHYDAHFKRKKEEADQRNWANEFSGDIRWQSISKSEVVAQAKQAYEIALRDQTEIFFSRVATFIQGQFLLHKQGKPSAMFDGPFKDTTVKTLTQELKDPELRQEIISSYFPGRPYYISRHSTDMMAALSLLAPFKKAQQVSLPVPQIEVQGLIPPSNVIAVDFTPGSAPQGPQPPAIQAA